MSRKIKKRSVLLNMLIPMLIAMIIQCAIIYAVIISSGTISQIKNNNISILNKSSENRYITLQNMMVSKWSDLEYGTELISADISDFFLQNNTDITALQNDWELSRDMLEEISPDIISVLRNSGTTGIFLIMSNGLEETADISDDMYFNGVYFRDLDPDSSVEGNSDLLMERGAADIGGDLGIPLDSFWIPRFQYGVKNADNKFWDSYFIPYQAATENPDYSLRDLGYWNTHSCLYNKNRSDSNYFITYSVPIFTDDVFVGVLGIELQLDYLMEYMPAGDVSDISGSGYILLNYDENENISAPNIINAQNICATGGVMKRIGDEVSLIRDERYTDLYRIDDTGSIGSDLYLSVNELKLYNTNTASSNEKWLLAAIGTDTSLFSSAENIQRNIIITAIITFLLCTVYIFLAVRYTTTPIRKMAETIRQQKDNPRLSLPPSSITEINELSDTINELSAGQQKIEAELREERERYLLAIESSLDVILEYSISNDILRIYHVTDNSDMYFNSYDNFKQLIEEGKICHPDDKSTMLKLLNGEISKQITFRVKRSVNSDGYLWFSCKVKPVYSTDGSLVKVIGSTRNVTEEKEREFAALEAIRRDPITGLYNREYGEKMAQRYIYSANGANIDFTICIIDIDNFSRIEELYGMLFCDAVLSEVSYIVTSLIGKNDVAFRIGGDEIAVLFPNVNPEIAESTIKKIISRIRKVYSGESADAAISVSVGASGCNDGRDYNTILEKALRTLHYVKNNNKGGFAFYSNLKAQKLPVDTRAYEPQRLSEISKMLDSLTDNIVNFTFNIFEKSSDIKSTINVMLPKLGRMFDLRRILICETSYEYSTTMISYQWNSDETAAFSTAAKKIDPEDYKFFLNKLSDDGTVLFDGKAMAELTTIQRNILHTDEESKSVFACAMYENGQYAGSVIFESNKAESPFSLVESEYLREISKIFSTQISRSRSDLASRAKSEFLSRMSHEIRTPMNAIIGMTEIAKSVENDPPRINDCLNKIDASTKYLLSLINDILDMSRIESGKLKLECNVIDLGEMIGNIDNLIRPQAENKNISFVTDINVKDNFLTGDAFRISQVLINLLGNAVKFTNENGHITLSVVQVMQENSIATLKFSVKDDGIGISSENTERIFNAFEQEEAATSRRFGGTGLGLSISSSIVKMMHGKLEVESELGKGSEFFFTIALPVADAPIKRKDNKPTPTDYTNHFVGKRALLVEDNPLNTEIAKYILLKSGFEVSNVEDGQKAVDAFTSADAGYYDVILMDIRMPVMDGLEATKRIRESDKSDAKTIPIVAMTANAFDDDMKKSIAFGMNGHIPKPIDTSKLFSLLDRLLYKP